MKAFLILIFLAILYHSSSFGQCLSVNDNSTHVNCLGGSDGTITLNPTNGQAPYTYTWNTGTATLNTGYTINGLSAGIYNVTVEDNLGCDMNTSIIISEPSTSLQITTNVTSNYNGADISCSSSCDGEVLVTASGGTAGYTYLWSQGGTTPSIAGLCAGMYYVTVYDANNCIATDSIEVTAPSALAATISNSVNVTCHGDCTGSATVVASGGLGSYLYLWPGGATAATVSNLCAGVYCTTVTDVNGCQASTCVTITEPSPINVQIVVQDTTCQGSSGNLLGLVTGGSSPYTYTWSHGTTNNPTTYSAAGNYCLDISDVNGCTATACTNVDTLDFEVNITNAILSGSQKYGITSPNNPQAIQTASSYPNETSYNWFPTTGLSCTNCPNPVVRVNVPTQYILNATHTTLGCSSADTIIVYPFSTDTIRLELAPDSTVSYCSNYPPFISGASSTGVGPLSYGSITYGLLSCFDYISNGSVQEGIDTLLWIDCATVTIGTFPTQICDTTLIYLTTATCVWPGDTDDDGIANNFDLLPIGQHYGTSGLLRTNANINYTCQPSLDWGTTILGMPTVDLKHVDTDGNGIINGADTNAIILNWTQTHLKNNLSSLTGIDLYVDTTTAAPGDMVRLPIILGNTSVPNGYGIAFTVNYDPAGVDTNTVSIDFDNSWLGTINNDLIGIHKDFYYQGQTEVALTRIDQTAVTGSGAVAHINFTIKDDVLPKTTFLRLDFDISNIRLIDPLGTIIPVTGVPTQILVTDGFTSTETIRSKQENTLTVFPNPTTGQIQIQSLVEEMESILIYNLTGTLLYQQENINALNTKLDLERLPTGIYIANVISKKGMQTVRIIKK